MTDLTQRRLAGHPNKLPRPKGELEALEKAWELPKGWRIIYGGQQHRHRLFLCRHGGAVLPACRHSRAADAAAARGAEQHVSLAGDLQPDLHDARHRDDVPVRRAGRRGDGRPVAAADARRARPAVPATECFRVLGLFRRRPHLLRHVVLRSCALRRLVHVSAADRHAVLARPRRGLLAARHRLHRDLGDRGRDRADRRRAAHARAGHDARPHADVRLDHADLRRDDRVRVSGRDPRDAAARTGARLRLAVLHSDRRAATRCCGSTCSGSSATPRSTSSSCPRPAWSR